MKKIQSNVMLFTCQDSLILEFFSPLYIIYQQSIFIGPRIFELTL